MDVPPDESKFFGIEEYDAVCDPMLNDTCVAKAITHEKYCEPASSWCQAKPSESEARQKPRDYELENLCRHAIAWLIQRRQTQGAHSHCRLLPVVLSSTLLVTVTATRLFKAGWSFIAWEAQPKA